VPGRIVRRYIIAAAVSIPLILVVFVAAGYASDELIGGETVSRGVTAGGIDISRLGTSDAVSAMNAYEDELTDAPLVVVIEGQEVELDPSDAGFAIDQQTVVADAMTVRRSDGLFANFRLWFSTFTSYITVEVPNTIDEESLRLIIEEWSDTVLDSPAHEGDVVLLDGNAVPEYPRSGLRIDVDRAVALISAELSKISRTPVVLPLESIAPQITIKDVDDAVNEANRLIGSPVVLTAEDRPGTIVFTRAGLAVALVSEIVSNSPAFLQVDLDPGKLREIARRSADNFIIPPVNATFTFDEETRELTPVPSIPGQKVDIERIPEVVSQAAAGSGSATIPMTEGAEADLTTEDAIAMGPLGEVSTFTTRHPCCANRVVNIQLLADLVGGSLVFPGETFSINDTAGERTAAKGFKRAGAIIAGRIQCCDSKINIGGGTSQFATTFYNAIFFGCYEDVFHQPHSLYFSRYPYVREATLGYPTPDVKFRNDSDAVVYIHTEYTSTSITVTFYGNNGGRMCTSERSGNTITRVMKHPDGSTTTETWFWKYRLHPTTAPTTTTTTTAPPVTTTTAPPATTTTTAPPGTTTTTNGAGG